MLDNALAETTIGLYKTECTREGSPFRTGPLETLADVEKITSEWVHWYNTSRLMHRLGPCFPRRPRPSTTMPTGRVTRPQGHTRAASTAQKPKKDLVLDRGAQGPGVRDWLTSLGHGHTKFAAFDTRFKGPAVLRGRASRPISRKLRKHGFEMVAKPESFFVTLENHLEPGEEARAREWGRRLAARILSNDVTNGDGPGRAPTSKET